LVTYRIVLTTGTFLSAVIMSAVYENPPPEKEQELFSE